MLSHYNLCNIDIHGQIMSAFYHYSPSLSFFFWHYQTRRKLNALPQWEAHVAKDSNLVPGR